MRRVDLKCITKSTDFVKKYPEYVAKNNALGFLSPDNGASYNLCHC